MRYVVTFAGAMLVAACVTATPQGMAAELVGRDLRVEDSNGRVSTVRLASDGTAQLTDGARRLAGRWGVEADRICFAFAGLPYECWSYAGPLRPGMTLPFTSDKGRTVRVSFS